MNTPKHVAGPETLPRRGMVSNALPDRFMRTLALVMALAIAGCKSDSSDGGTGPIPPVPPTPPVVTGIPTASFTVAATANAFDPVTFDAAASTSTDGSALQYVWDFGNGQRGGGKTITRSFASGGTRSVMLTVFDGANRSASASMTIAIAAPPAPVANLSAQGFVKALDGTALMGVMISQVAVPASSIGLTDSTGKARLNLGTGSPLTLRFSKAGYADQLLNLTLPATTGSDAAFEVTMRTRDAALTLADAAAGGSVTGRDGALLTLPANALVNGAGAAVTGAVQISITPVDVTQNGAGGFPGGFNGLAQNGIATPIVSFGTSEYVLTSGGQNVQVAPGKSATIELPLYATKKLNGTLLAVGDTTPLWSLDESTGAWVQEGAGTVVASANSPSGLALRAAVTHFSWWNSDIGFDPYGPQPRCVYDTDIGLPGGNDTFATATICNMLAQIDVSGGGPAPKVMSGTPRPAAAVLSPRIAGFASRRSVPIGGGVTIPVPANLNVLLKATALNGTWGGSTVVNGPVGAQVEALIKMRPLFAAAGPTPEAITLPFDGTRALVALQPTALFTFAGAASKFARVQLSPAPGSVLTGRVRVLQGTTVLSTATIVSSTAQITAALSANATYTIEVAGDAAAAFRLQVELFGGLQTEPIVLPLDITRTIAPYVTFNGTLTVTAPTTIYLARQSLFGQADLRLLAANGAVLLDGTSLPDAARGASLTLPAAGTYTVEIRPRVNGNSTNIRLTAEQTLWVQIAPPIVNAGTAGGSFELVDAQADRNGKVVVAYTEAAGTTNRFKLQRWSGTAWEAAATDLVVDQPCTGSGNMMSFTFDDANNPIVVYGNRNDPAASTFVTVRRYSGGAWQALGPNNGTLPLTSLFGASCRIFPALTIGSDGAPIAAYQYDNNVVVQRFDGTQWKGLAKPDSSGDVFLLQNGNYDLKVDAAGRVWFVTGSPIFTGIPALVRRFNATTLAWETIGGGLTQTNTSGLQTPRLRFDAAGLPIVAWIAAVGTGGVASPGAAVYRYDGAAWSTTGGYQPGGNFAAAGTNDLGFAIINGEAVVSWTSSNAFGPGVIAQRNTASGWTAIGTGLGEIAQFSPGVINDVRSNSSKLVSIGGQLYLALIAIQPVGANFQYQVALLRRVAN